MFDPKQSVQPKQDSNNLNPLNLNSGKDSPFKKVDEGVLAPQKNKPKDVEDILAGSDKKVEAPKLEEKPKEPTDKFNLKENVNVPSMDKHTPAPTGQMTAPKMTPAPTAEKSNLNLASRQQAVDKKSNLSGKILTIVAVVLIVAVLGLAGMYAYSYFNTDSETNLDSNLLENNTSGEELEQFLDTLNNQENNEELEGPTRNEDDLPDYSLLDQDSDEDGLEDYTEIELGTDPNNPDTDNDGLNDFNEVNIYHSDPINPDTDGDTYLDGDEVENGYDPLRPGSARL